MHSTHSGAAPEPLATERVDFEHKRFFLDLKENQRGRVFKITEDSRGKRNTIMLPSGAAAEFLDAMRRIVEFESTL
jgi:hypothetical protein